MGVAAKPVDNGFMPVFKIKAILNTQRFIQFDSFWRGSSFDSLCMNGMYRKEH